MQQNSLDAGLASFRRATREDWKRAAMKELDGSDPFDSLSWQTEDNLSFAPYYDADDVRNNRFTQAIHHAIRKHEWLNLPTVRVGDVDRAAEYAREHISGGADGVLLHVGDRNFKFSDFAEKLSSGFLALYVEPELAEMPGDSLSNRIDAVFGESFSDNFLSARTNTLLGILVASATPAVEISKALISGVALFERLAAYHAPDSAFRRIGFCVSCGPRIAETSAKLRALRGLWFQVARAYGIEDYGMTDVHLHAQSRFTHDADHGPQENMLKGTYAAVGAVLGGCNSLSIESPDDPPFNRRWARNVSHILKEESFFGRKADPLGGAYAIDVLTSSFAEHAWRTFTESMSS